MSNDSKTILATSNPSQAEIENYLQQINAFRKSCQLFASTLQHYSNSNIHVCGTQSVFSFYSFQNCTLNISSKIIDTEELDKRVAILADEVNKLVKPEE